MFWGNCIRTYFIFDQLSIRQTNDPISSRNRWTVKITMCELHYKGYSWCCTHHILMLTLATTKTSSNSLFQDVYLVFHQIIWQVSLKSVKSYMQNNIRKACVIYKRISGKEAGTEKQYSSFLRIRIETQQEWFYSVQKKRW